MPLLGNSTILDSLRITRLIQDQSTRYQATLPLRFLDRLPLVPADDDEIIASITAKNFAADLVADDQAAAVYDGMALEFVTNAIPNIKIGTRLSQSLLNRLARMSMNLATTQDASYFTNWEVTTVNMLLRNVRERANMLACAMMTDSLNYSKNGVTVVGNWGMPSNLKVTPSTLWTSTSATPISDILTLKYTAATTYGEVYTRLTISTPDMLNLFATTEFKGLIAGLTEIASPVPIGGFNTRDARNTRFFSELLQMEIEVEDKLLNTPNPDGTLTSSRVLPLGKVILSTVADDKDPSAMDFGNAVVTEAVAAQLVQDFGPDNFPVGEQFGPIAFYTLPNAQLNPPGALAWAVMRGFPRKHRKTATAVLTVQ